VGRRRRGGQDQGYLARSVLTSVDATFWLFGFYSPRILSHHQHSQHTFWANMGRGALAALSLRWGRAVGGLSGPRPRAVRRAGSGAPASHLHISISHRAIHPITAFAARLSRPPQRHASTAQHQPRQSPAAVARAGEHLHDMPDGAIDKEALLAWGTLNPALKRAVIRLGYREPTEIQRLSLSKTVAPIWVCSQLVLAAGAC
jgi:hypothetical protein